MRVTPIVAWFDMWVGAYWDSKNRRLYILPLPCIGVVIHCKAPPSAKGEQDALCTMLANARHEAARLGYCAGHNDTVEGTYTDPSEAAADICQEMDDDGEPTP